MSFESFGSFNPAERETDYHKNIRLAKEAIELIDSSELDLPETLLPAARITAFNALRSGADTDKVRSLLSGKMLTFAKKERRAHNQNNPLPTIGFELEIKESDDVHNMSGAFQAMDIYNQLEVGTGQGPHTDPNLWEINPGFSYAASTQSKIIQEVLMTGTIPLDDTSERRTDKSFPLSLHINLGAPEGLQKSNIDIRRAGWLTSILTTAFSSPTRIQNRKTHQQVKVRTKAEPSDKNKKERDPDGEDGPVRLELRSLEFADYPAFRLLTESQRLGALLMSKEKQEAGLPLSECEGKLAELWEGFEEETISLLNNYKLNEYSVDRSPELVALFLESSPLQQESRSLVGSYSRIVAATLKEYGLEEN